MIRRALALLALGCLVSLRAQTPAAPSQPRLSADVVGGDLKVATLRGKAEFRDTGLLLTADAIDFEYETRKATATGHVVFTRADTRLLADKLVYQGLDGSFSAESVRLGQFPFYAEGRSAVGTRDEILLEDARVAYGEPGPWQPTVTAQRVLYAPGRRLQTDNAQAGVGDRRFLPFPRLRQDLAAPLAASISAAGGYRRSLGLIAEVGVHIPVSAALRVGGDVGIYTSRGVMIGPSGRYSAPGDAEKLRGYFRSGFINDHGDKGVDLIGRPVPENRAYVEWQHTQRLAENLELKAQLNWWKDSEVVRDFRPRAFFPVQQPDTFVEAVYAAPNYFLSAFARFQPNSFHREQERLPEIRFDLVPSALGNGFYQRFHASAAVLREDPLPMAPGSLALSTPALGADRLDAYYALERPFAPREWFAFTPIAGGRVTHYANIAGVPGSRNYTRTLGEAGFDAALRTSGTFAYRNEQWKIDGLRHLFTPRVSYRYIPRGDRGIGRIPRIDREAFFSTYLPPLGLGDQRNIDELRATNTLRVALDNILQTRDRRDGTRDLLALNVANDFRFKRRRGERDVSETHLELSAMPARWLQFDVYQSLAPQTFTLRELNSALTIRDGQLWSLRFSNHFLRHEIEDYLVDGRFRINESYEAVTRLHYDARRRRFNEQAYGVAHNVGNQWLISYTVSLYSGRRRESSFGFNVQIDTVRF